MWKRVCAGGFALVVAMFSGIDQSSISGGPGDSKESVFQRNYKPDGFDSLVFSYDDYLKHAVDTNFSPGAAVAIVCRGEIVLLRGYGYLKSGTHDSVNIHTAFRIGSVSKGFASVLTGIMVNDGYLNWDDHVRTYIPDFRMKDTAAASQLTIRHILSHTSGFPEHTYTDMLDNGFTYDCIKTTLGDVPLAAKPGKVYGYQNVVYSLIGDVLQNATGTDYNTLLREKIFVPLHMNEASSDFASFSNNENAAFPHLRYGHTWKVRSKNDRYYSVAPAGGVNASAADMAQWLLALTGYYPEVVSDRTIHDVSQSNIETPRKYAYKVNWKTLDRTSYGMGWRIFHFDNHNLIYHGGYVEGFRTEIAFDPVESVGIVVMFNSNTSFASHCVPTFFDRYYHLKPTSGSPSFLVNN